VLEGRDGRAVTGPGEVVVVTGASTGAAASRVEEAFGPIEVWVNNAMVSVFSPIRDMEVADWVKSRLPRRPQPMGPIFQPEVAAGAIVWAAAPRPARDQRRLADRRGHPRREAGAGLPGPQARA
jgi:hypothetical protein